MSVGTRRKKYVERALQGGLLTLEIVKEVSDLAGVPYLPKVAGLVLKIFEIIEAVKDNKSGFTELAKDATNILSILLDYYDSRSAAAGASEWLPDSLKDVVEKLTQTLVDTIYLANKNILRPIFFRVSSSKADTGDITKLRLRIDASLKAFEVQSHLGINQKLSELMSLQLNKDAESKRAATLSRRTQVMKELEARIHRGAGFDASARSDIPKCTPQTREAIRKHIQDWIESGDDTKQIMWLYGPAGSGKTTIGQTIAQLYEEYQRLLASFFFSRSAGDSRPTDNTAFVTTITFDFCISIPGLIDYVGDAISKDANIFNRNLSRQMQSLLIDPLNQLIKDRVLDESAPKNWWLVLVDGLDECDDDDAQREALSLLLMLIQKTNLPLRVLVASRPEHSIRSFINGSKMGPLFVHSLALEANYSANEDIKTFLLSEFDAIKETHPAAPKLPADWPHDEDVHELVTRADGLFIYASVVMKYISSEEGHPLERSKQIIKSLRLVNVSASNLPFAQLDAMYAYILSKIPPDNRQKVRDVLCFRLCSNINVPYVTDFESLFDLQSGGLSTLLKPLAAVMTVSDTEWKTLSFIHASFPDFLQDLSRLTSSSVPEFACVLNNDMHARLALAWLRYYANIPTTVFAHHGSGDYIWASTALREICHHCREANLWNVLKPALQTFVMRLSFPEDLKNKQEQWLRVHYCLDILLWIRSQEHNATARTLYDQHRQHLESALRGYWSQIPPEVQFFLPFLLLHKLDINFINFDGMQRILWQSVGTAAGRLLSEIFLKFTDNAWNGYSQSRGNKQAHKFVIWAATILIEQQPESNHPYDDFVAPDNQPGVLAVVLDSARADLELDAFLRSSNLVHVAERNLAEPDEYDFINPGCKKLLKAIEKYHAKCDELRTQLRTVESDSLPSDTPIDGSYVSNAVIQLTGISSERKSSSMTATENGHDEAVLSAADGTSDLERTQSLKEPTDGEDVNTVPLDILRPETEPTKHLADGDPVGVLLIPRIQVRAADGSRKIFAVMSLVVASLSYFGMKYIFEQRSA